MSRLIRIALILLGMMVFVGCVGVKDDPRFRADPAEVSAVISDGFFVPDATAIDIIEQIAVNRSAYRAGLERLLEYYNAGGDGLRGGWADRELKALLLVPQYRYVMPAESAAMGLRATDTIAEADELYAEAMKFYNEAGGLLIILNDDKLRMALGKFNDIIARYPSSDKIDESAYRAGKIYEHFGDYEIAAVYYQRAFQWDEQTAFPARYKAAYILDQRLHMRKEALVLYQLACEKESMYTNNVEFAKQRILRMTAEEKAQAEGNTEESQSQTESESENSE